MPGKENKQRAADSVSRFFLNLKHVVWLRFGIYIYYFFQCIVYHMRVFKTQSLRFLVDDFYVPTIP